MMNDNDVNERLVRLYDDVNNASDLFDRIMKQAKELSDEGLTIKKLSADNHEIWLEVKDAEAYFCNEYGMSWILPDIFGEEE